ncbi:MAG TPA: SMP-30/gluconolactonase/LRE family protein [Candidatus Binatia bacterium]
MKITWLASLFFGLALASGCATMGGGGEKGKVSILVDLDPASADRTVIVESITADRQGRLYLADRVSGDVLRVDPRYANPVPVARIEPREIQGKKTNADASGVEFNQQGDLFIASGPFSAVVRVHADELNPQKPGRAQMFATGAEGANGIAFDKQGNLYISGGRTGKIYRVGPGGGSALPFAEIPGFVRTLPDGKTEQTIVANGLAFDSRGALYAADTARGAVWRITIGADGKAAKPEKITESPLLEGADGLAFDKTGKLWVTANERNALVTIAADGKVQEVTKNGGKGPLEFPSAIVFVGDTAYISNNDTPRRDNMDANGKTALDGIGASIARITP